jgi:hypothetical protein
MVASRLLPMSAWRQHGSNMAAWQPLRALPDPWRSPPCGMWCGPYHTLGCYPHTPPYHPPRSPGLGSGGILGRGGVGAGVWNPGWGLGSCGSGGGLGWAGGIFGGRHVAASRLLPMAAWRQLGSNTAAQPPLRALPDPWRSSPCGMWRGPYQTLGTPPCPLPRSPGVGSGGSWVMSVRSGGCD